MKKLFTLIIFLFFSACSDALPVREPENTIKKVDVDVSTSKKNAETSLQQALVALEESRALVAKMEQLHKEVEASKSRCEELVKKFETKKKIIRRRKRIKKKKESTPQIEYSPSDAPLNSSGK